MNKLFAEQCWFVSKSGMDSDSCGRIVSDPCKTLNELLTIIYHEVYPYVNSTNFYIVTDYFLSINRKIMVSYIYLPCTISHLSCVLLSCL